MVRAAQRVPKQAEPVSPSLDASIPTRRPAEATGTGPRPAPGLTARELIAMARAARARSDDGHTRS